MNKKIFEKFIFSISILGTIIGLVQTLVELLVRRGSLEFWCALLLFVALVTTSIYLYKLKAKFVDTVSICSVMALNNGLQALREAILIQDRRLKENYFTGKIAEAKFFYTISPSMGNMNSYDVHYFIEFKINKGFRLKNRTFQFYVISLAAEPQNLVTRVVTDGCEQLVKSSKKNCTIKGESGNAERMYAGLYEIITVIPQNLIEEKEIKIDYSYDVIGQIKAVQEKHNFVIIPENYSRKIKKMEVRVKGDQVQLENLELQHYGRDTTFEIAEPFFLHKSELDSGNCIFYTSTVPDMSAAYMIQLDLPKKVNDETEGKKRYV